MGLDDQDKSAGTKSPTIRSQQLGEIPVPRPKTRREIPPSTPKELEALRLSVKRSLEKPSDSLIVQEKDLPRGSKIDTEPNGDRFLTVPIPLHFGGDIELVAAFNAPRQKRVLPDQKQVGGWSQDQTVIFNVRFPINSKGTSVTSTAALPGERLYEARPDAGMFLAGVSQSLPESISILPGKATIMVEFGATVLPDSIHKQALIFASQELVKDRNKITAFVFRGLVNSYNVWDYTTVASGRVALAGGYHSRNGVGSRVRFFPRDDHTLEVSFFRNGVELGYSYDFHH